MSKSSKKARGSIFPLKLISQWTCDLPRKMVFSHFVVNTLHEGGQVKWKMGSANRQTKKLNDLLPGLSPGVSLFGTAWNCGIASRAVQGSIQPRPLGSYHHTTTLPSGGGSWDIKRRQQLERLAPFCYLNLE